MKKILAVLLTTSILLPLAVTPAHASGFSAANILGGGSQVRGELKATHGGSGDTYYSSSETGTGASRVVCDTMKKSWKKHYALVESGFADPLSGTNHDSIHFAHARINIALKKINNENVVLRLFPILSDETKDGDANKDKSVFNLVYSNKYSTYGWMSTYGKNGSGIPYGVTEYDRCHIYTSSDPTNMATKSYEGRNFLKWGSSDTPVYQTFDFIFDCYKGYVYGYIDGRLIATKINAEHFDNFLGYTICGTADETSFTSGTKLWFKYDTERPGETLYVDTDNYTVRLEDVLVDAGLASNNGDPDQIMESDHIADYVFAGDFDYDYYDTYERRDPNGVPVSVTAEKILEDQGNVAQLYGGCYYKGKDWPGYSKGAGVIYVGFDQKINKKLNSGSNVASNNYSFNVLTENNQSRRLFSMTAASGNKMRITLEKQLGNNNPEFVLDKDFNDTIHYDIILYGKHATTAPQTGTAEAMGYYFADGHYLGSYTINRGADKDTPGTDIWWTPTQLFLSGNNTANVTYSDYKIALYDENKSIEDLIAEIDDSQIGWTDTQLTVGEGSYADTFTVSGRIAAGNNTIPQTAKAYIGVYDKGDKLLDCSIADYTSETITSKRFPLSCNGEAPSYVKLFLWDGMEPVTAQKNIMLRIDPMTYYMKVSYNNGMSWNKTDYRADHSDVTEYDYPVENRETLKGAIRKFDNIYMSTTGEYAGSVINLEDSVFDTVTITKGERSVGYAFLAAKPEEYTNSRKLPNGYTPTYAAGYTRVVYTDDQTTTLTIPDNAKYLYLCNKNMSGDTNEYDVGTPSAVTLSKSGETQNRDKLRIATWNIGHFCLGSYTYSTIDSLGFTAKEYRDYINAINADVVSLNEYSEMFTANVDARSAIFSDYPTAYIGEQNQYTCNALFARNDVLSNIQRPHYFDCYTAAGGSGTDKPTDHYYITSDLTVNGETVKLVNVHLHYSDNPQTLAIQAINELIDAFSGYDKVIIMGDCNVTYEKFKIFEDAGYGIAQTDSKLATYGPCQGNEKYYVDISEGYGSYDNIIYKGVTVSNFALGGTKLSDHYGLYCDVEVD